MWSSIIFTAVSTSRSTSWGCFCAMRWISSDFVIGPLWRVRWGAASVGAGGVAAPAHRERIHLLS